jgi:hypothetical protein
MEKLMMPNNRQQETTYRQQETNEKQKACFDRRNRSFEVM